MKSFIPADQEIRLMIETQLDHTLAVSAGAGTGKTTLLTKRYISLLQQKKISPTEIVAITFTKKAAAELRERIYIEMTKQNLNEALLQIELAPIGTIHSFCATVLKRFAIESGLDPHFRQLEGIERYDFLRNAFRTWISHNVMQSQIFQQVKSAGVNFSSIQYIAFQLYEYRDLIHSIQIEFDPINQNRISEFVAKTKNILKFGNDFCQDMTDEGFAAILRLNQTVGNIENISLMDAGKLLLREDGISKKGRQTSWKSKEHGKQFKADVDDLRANLETLQKDFSAQLLKELVQWLEGFLDFIEREKKSKSVLDFDDLLLLTRNLIRNNLHVRKILQEQFKYFLIDEFQDTDPIQTEIFWMLAREGEDGEFYDARLIPGKIFTVGDASQSIYRFRNASVETYKRCVSSIEHQGKLLFIHQNFRSNPNLLNSLNPFFSSLLQTDFHELSSLPTDSWNKQAIHVLEGTADEGLKYVARGHEANSIASHIRYLIDSKKEIFDHKNGQHRKINYSDIAILFPVSTSMEIYESAFKNASIPFSLYRSSSFFQTLEIRSVLKILNAVARPFDELEVASALSSFLMGYSFDDLNLIKKEFNSFDYRNLDAKKLPPQLQKQIEIIQTLHKNFCNLTPSGIIQQILESTNAISLSHLKFNNEQTIQNLQKIKWLALDFEKDHGMNVFEFVEWINRCSEHTDDITEARIPTQPNAVQLMTIHQSKGLEFSVVFVANLTSKLQQNVTWVANRFENSLEFRVGDRFSHFKTRNFDHAAELEKSFLLEEKKRLIYVALTRAKNILIIPSPSEDDQKTFMEFVAPLFKDGSDFERFKYQGRNILNVLVPSEIPIFDSIKIDNLKNIPAGYTRTTATDEKEIQIKHTKRPYAFLTRPKLGIAFHAYVERSTQSELQPDLFNQIVHENGLDGQFEKFKELIQTYLKSSLYQRIKNSTQTLKEVPFSYFDHGILTEGYIDLLFEEADGWVILDLKTDAISEQQLKERSSFYSNQLEIYSKALEQNKMKVKEKALYFVNLDQYVQC